MTDLPRTFDSAPFRSDQHAWACGLIAGVLGSDPELMTALPMLDREGINHTPEILVSVGGREFRVIVQERL